MSTTRAGKRTWIACAGVVAAMGHVGGACEASESGPAADDGVDFCALWGWEVRSLALRPDGDILVAGTAGEDPPIPAQYFGCRSALSAQDVYVARLSSDGSRLISMCVLGGSGDQEVLKIAAGAGGEVVVVGRAEPRDDLEPEEAAAEIASGQTRFRGRMGFVWVLDSDLRRLILSRPLEQDRMYSAATAVATGEPGEVVVGGYRRERGENRSDGWVRKIDWKSRDHEWVTVFEGDHEDVVDDIEVDTSGCVFVAGTTSSEVLVAGERSGQADERGLRDVFVARMDPDGTVRWIVRLGGEGYASSARIELDGKGHVVVACNAGLGWPLVGDGALEFGGNLFGCGSEADVAVVKLHVEVPEIVFSTYLGGEDFDDVKDLAILPNGDICVLCSSWSKGFPAVDRTNPVNQAKAAKGVGIGDGRTIFFSRISGATGELLFSLPLWSEPASQPRARLVATGENAVVLAGQARSGMSMWTEGALRWSRGKEEHPVIVGLRVGAW